MFTVNFTVEEHPKPGRLFHPTDKDCGGHTGPHHSEIRCVCLTHELLFTSVICGWKEVSRTVSSCTLSSSPFQGVLFKSIVLESAGRRTDGRCRFHLPLARGWRPSCPLHSLCCSVLWESKHSTPAGVEERCPRWTEGRKALQKPSILGPLCNLTFYPQTTHTVGQPAACFSQFSMSFCSGSK